MSAPGEPEDERPAQESFLRLVPRRDLVRAAILLAVLVGILALRNRVGAIVKGLGETLGAATPARTDGVPSRPSGTGTAPRVRLERPPGALAPTPASTEDAR